MIQAPQWQAINSHMSHEKKPLTFRCTGWLIGILIMVYYTPYILGSIIPYITQPTRVFFVAHMGICGIDQKGTSSTFHPPNVFNGQQRRSQNRKRSRKGAPLGTAGPQGWEMMQARNSKLQQQIGLFFQVVMSLMHTICRHNFIQV